MLKTVSVPKLSIPFISLTKLAQNGAEHEKLFKACRDYGFFYLTDHGVSRTLLSNTIESSRRFFGLPIEVKNRFNQSQQLVWPRNSRGYSPLYGEILHADQGPDPKEIFDFGPDKPLSKLPFTGPTIAPDDSLAPGFVRWNMELQSDILGRVLPDLLRGLSCSLGWDPEWFLHHFLDPIVIHRNIHYPAKHGVAGKHTDGGILTILIQEPLQESSLRIFTKNSWIDAECHEDAFVVNLGDMLQTWTGGLFVSTPHQVRHFQDVDRISIPFFIHPQIGSKIRPMDSEEEIESIDLTLGYFKSMGDGVGAGRARELV